MDKKQKVDPGTCIWWNPIHPSSPFNL